MQNVTIRQPADSEFIAIRDLCAECPPLEVYPVHLYRIMLCYWGNTCLLAEQDGLAVGFVQGLFSQTASAKTYFLWQIAVHPKNRKQGVGQCLLRAIETTVRHAGGLFIHATIDPENKPSRALFTSHGYVNVSANQEATTTELDQPAMRDYYGPGRHFMLYEKALINGRRPAENTGETNRHAD